MVTVAQAQAAAPLASLIATLTSANTDMQNTVTANGQITEIVVTVAGGPKTQLTLSYPLDPATSAAILNAIISLFVAEIAALTEQLGAI